MARPVVPARPVAARLAAELAAELALALRAIALGPRSLRTLSLGTLALTPVVAARALVLGLVFDSAAFGLGRAILRSGLLAGRSRALAAMAAVGPAAAAAAPLVAALMGPAMLLLAMRAPYFDEDFGLALGRRRAFARLSACRLGRRFGRLADGLADRLADRLLRGRRPGRRLFLCGCLGRGGFRRSLRDRLVRFFRGGLRPGFVRLSGGFRRFRRVRRGCFERLRPASPPLAAFPRLRPAPPPARRRRSASSKRREPAAR